MIDFKGRYASCRVFADAIEETAEEQIKTFLDCPAFDGAKIRIMPDVHAGAGAVIGFTAPLGDKVIPNVIGVDIGCGVHSVLYGDRAADLVFADFDRLLRLAVPAGFSVRERPYARMESVWNGGIGDGFAEFQEDVDLVSEKTGQDHGRVWKSIGTLGGGNHFIEIGKDDDGNVWLTVHSGSRNFGLKVALHHQKKAIAQMGKQGGLEWLSGDDAEEYLRDMRTAQKFADLNRRCMLDAIGDFMPEPDGHVASVHNFIGDDDVIRKGAISAHYGEKVVIPWNMRDGLIIGRGKGKEDWNNSAPHGAGRVMGRKQAKRTLDADEFFDDMRSAGIWSTCVGPDTLDESPEAYKDHSSVKLALAESVTVERTVRPVYSFKASKHIYDSTGGKDDRQSGAM